jgi:hypothetical protein
MTIFTIIAAIIKITVRISPALPYYFNLVITGDIEHITAMIFKKQSRTV